MRKNPKEKKHPRIRRRVFAYLAAFVAFVLALLWLMQIVWLDDFYRWDKTRQITQAADAVESNIGNEQLSALMDRLAQQNDVCILLLDSSKHVFLSSDDIHYCLIHRMSSRDLSFWCSMIPENGNTLTKLFNIAPFGGDQYNSHQFRGNVPKMEDDKKQSLLCARRRHPPRRHGRVSAAQLHHYPAGQHRRDIADAADAYHHHRPPWRNAAGDADFPQGDALHR